MANRSRGIRSGGNHSGGNLSGGNLSGGNLSGGNRSGGNLSGGNLSGGNRSGGNLSGGNLSGGNRSGGNLSGGNSIIRALARLSPGTLIAVQINGQPLFVARFEGFDGLGNVLLRVNGVLIRVRPDQILEFVA
jgi:uncharacterized protein YjbI with pentapeptide repeats